MADLHRSTKILDVPPPASVQFSSFSCSFEKIWPNNMLALPLGLATPRLGKAGSTAVYVV